MRRSGSKRRRLVAACAGSAALHAGVLWLAAHTSWTPAEPEPSRQVAVIWLENWPIPVDALPEPVTRAEPRAAAPPPQPEPEAPDADEPEPEAPDAAEREPEPEADESQQEPPEADESERDVSRSDESAPEEPARESASTAPEVVIDRADLEEATRRAREEMRERLERERNYLTFSRDDLVGPAPPEEPEPTESIFEAAERAGSGSGGASVLSPSKARTRFGRRLAELCNALSGGGIGLMGFATICADEGESPKLFADLKPAYLRSRPVCTQVGPDAVVAEVEIDGVVADVDTDVEQAEDGGGTIKCRLVLQDE